MAVDPFTLFLVGWAGGKMLDLGTRTFLNNIDTYADALRHSPKSEGWNSELEPDQISLLKTFARTQPSTLKRYISKVTPAQSRPILILGPSGAGKTCVALRLAGENPEGVAATLEKPDEEKFAATMRAINVIAPPGSRLQGDYLDTAAKILKSNKPPSVVCVVVASGFHATALARFRGRLEEPNFDRPTIHTGDPLPQNLTEYRRHCFDEEEEYLKDIYEMVCKEMKRSIPWVITIVNKRDLWSPYRNALQRYTSSSSEYGKLLGQLRGASGWGGPDGSITSHAVLPVYLTDDGFAPDPSYRRSSLTQAHCEADAMVLRAVIFNKYAQGQA